jgi:hypothetical protein
MQFGEDWPGLFLRGDDCMRFLTELRVQPPNISAQQALLYLMENAIQGHKNERPPELLKSFEECKIEA